MSTRPPAGAPTPARTPTEAAPSTSGPRAMPVSDEDLHRLVSGVHHDPHGLLGPHPFDGAVTVRSLRPWATSVAVIIGDHRYDMRHESYGIWVTVLPMAAVPDYRLEVAYDGPARAVD